MKKTYSIAFVLMLVVAAMPALAMNNAASEKAVKGVDAMPMMSQNDKDMVHFHVEDPMSRNSVTFRSEAPLEDIIGMTSQITGHLAFDPAHPEKGGSGELSIPVTSLNTGIPLRDEHLQGADWLNAAKYPNITLSIVGLKDIKVVKASDEFTTYDIVAVGELAFNGHSNMVTLPGRLTYLKETDKTKAKMPGDLLAARAEFKIRLSDYGVTGPEGAGLIGSKVGEHIGIEVSIMGSNAMETMADSK